MEITVFRIKGKLHLMFSQVLHFPITMTGRQSNFKYFVEPTVDKWWLMHLDNRIIQWTRQSDLMAIKVHVFLSLRKTALPVPENSASQMRQDPLIKIIENYLLIIIITVLVVIISMTIMIIMATRMY